MNPLLAWIVAHTTARTLSRTCGRCGKVQAVPQARAREAIPCAACGALVPPPTDAR